MPLKGMWSISHNTVGSEKQYKHSEKQFVVLNTYLCNTVISLQGIYPG